jgi:hypothetical protein
MRAGGHLRYRRDAPERTSVMLKNRGVPMKPIVPHDHVPTTTANVRPIPRLRFDALAGYIRQPSSALVAEELAWYAHADGRVLGLLLLDRTDQDFGGIVLGRDARRRFRCIDVIGFLDDETIVRRELLERLEQWSRRSDADFHQGDEHVAPVDFFTPIVTTEKLSQAFVHLATAEGFSCARQLTEAMMSFYEDVDGNFVEQFQTTGFDARFWELYVFALLTEVGFVLDRSFAAPDFLCEGYPQDMFVEAVTVNPSRSGNLIIEPRIPTTRDDLQAHLKNYMPIKWGRALTGKLSKEYWKLPHVAGKPIVLAIQGFHAPRAMTFTHSTLQPYLYGVEFLAYHDSAGILRVKTNRIAQHVWKDKTIDSGFFYLPGAEMISAVIHNPTATLSKFNRMGQLAGFGSPSIRMIRAGIAYNPAPNASVPRWYTRRLDDPTYSETWVEGLNVFHNPNAVHPLDRRTFPDAMHHRLDGESIVHTIPRFHPYSAETVILAPKRIKS